MHFEEFPSTVDLAGSYAETSQNVLSDMKEGAQALAEYPKELVNLILSTRLKPALMTMVLFLLVSTPTFSKIEAGAAEGINKLYDQLTARDSIAGLVDCSDQNPESCLAGASDCVEGVQVFSNNQIANPEALLKEFNTFPDSEKKAFMLSLNSSQVDENGYLSVGGRKLAFVNVGDSLYGLGMEGEQATCVEFLGSQEKGRQVIDQLAKANEGSHPVQLASNL